jgi:hypothetical protein
MKVLPNRHTKPYCKKSLSPPLRFGDLRRWRMGGAERQVERLFEGLFAEAFHG